MVARGVKKVLMTGDTVGGVWTFCLDLAEALTASGIEVLLATFGPTLSEEQKTDAASIQKLQWRHFTSKLEWMEDPWADISLAGVWLDDLRAQYKPDVIHLNTLSHADRQCALPVVQTVHSCVLSWWQAVNCGPAPSTWDTYRQRVKASLSAATLVTAPSRSMLHSVSHNYNVMIDESWAIHNGRRDGAFRAGAKEQIIFGAGRLWDQAKNLKVLGDIAHQLSWPVYLAGDTRNPNGMETTFDHCRLLGILAPSQVASWCARSSIYVLPARYEPFGLSILEAALSGCALVLGDIPSLRELWDNNAVFVDPTDSAGIEQALIGLIRNHSSRADMAHKALRRAIDFTQAGMARGYLSAYHRAASLFQAKGRRYACAS